MSKESFSSRFGGPRFPQVTEDELRAIICEGDAAMLNEVARQMGEDLSRSMTTSQIRSIFGAVRQIQLNWPSHTRHSEQEKAAIRHLTLLKPRLAYQAARHGQGMKDLSNVLTAAINLIGKDRTRFQYFVEFFEAILAYHLAAGGR